MAASGFYSCSKQDLPTVKPAESAVFMINGKRVDTTGTALWNTFVRRVEAGEIIDPYGQYVKKGTRMTDEERKAHPRPKFPATWRTLASVREALAGHYNPDARPAPPTEPPCDYTDPNCQLPPGGGGVPPAYTFVSTETVQPWNPGNSFGPTFYSTDNPNGYVFDLKLTKAYGNSFNNSPYYHNLPADLNEGAGGDYIYLSFTRDPQGVQYQRASEDMSCGESGDEQPRGALGPSAPYLNLPVTGVYTKAYSYFNGYSREACFMSDDNRQFFPIYAKRNGPPVNSNYMVILDMNDSAGGNYIFGYQTRTTNPSFAAVEVGILSGDVDYVPAPSGWTKVGDDLNKGPGGNTFISASSLARISAWAIALIFS